MTSKTPRKNSTKLQHLSEVFQKKLRKDSGDPYPKHKEERSVSGTVARLACFKPRWLISLGWGGRFFFCGLGAENWPYYFLIWLVLGFFLLQKIIFLILFLRFFFFKFKFILLQNFRGKKRNGFKEKFTLRFTKEEEENK